jgi:hypothetical protein
MVAIDTVEQWAIELSSARFDRLARATEHPLRRSPFSHRRRFPLPS